MLLSLLASGNTCLWVIWILLRNQNNNNKKTYCIPFYKIYMYIFFWKKKDPLKVESPMFHVQHCQLVWQRWESWQPSGGLRAQVWNGRDLIPHVMRPNRAGRETLLACPLRQRIKQQLPACHASASSAWPSFSAIAGATWKAHSIVQLGQRPLRPPYKNIHLLIHLCNIFQKFAMPGAVQSVLGCGGK